MACQAPQDLAFSLDSHHASKLQAHGDTYCIEHVDFMCYLGPYT